MYETVSTAINATGSRNKGLSPPDSLVREIRGKRLQTDVIAFSSRASTPSVPGRRPRVIARTARKRTVLRAAIPKKHADSGGCASDRVAASPLPFPDA